MNAVHLPRIDPTRNISRFYRLDDQDAAEQIRLHVKPIEAAIRARRIAIMIQSCFRLALRSRTLRRVFRAAAERPHV